MTEDRTGPYPGKPSAEHGHTYRCDVMTFTVQGGLRVHEHGARCDCQCHLLPVPR